MATLERPVVSNGPMTNGFHDDIDESVDDDDVNLLSDHSNRDDHALLSFPEISNKSDEYPAQTQLRNDDHEDTAPHLQSHSSMIEVVDSLMDVPNSRLDHDHLQATQPPLSSTLRQSPVVERSVSSTDQTHPDFVAPSTVVPNNVTEGICNRRLSWAERRYITE